MMTCFQEVYPWTIRTARLALFVLFAALLAPLYAEDIPEITVIGERVKSESDLRIGSFEFNPYVAVRGVYNDNIFYKSEDKEDDFIAILTPGFRMKYPFSNHSLQLDWQSHIYHYADHTELNTISEHMGNLQLNLDYDKWFVQLKENFAYLDEVGDPEVEARAARWINDTKAVAGVRFKPVDFTADYTKSLHRWVWDPDHDLNYMQDIYGARLDFKTFDTLKPYLRYEFQQFDFDGELNIAKYGQIRRNNQDHHQVLAGLNGTVVENLTWEVAVGWQHIWLRTYHSDWEPNLAPRDSDHLVAKARANWDVKPDSLRVSAFAERKATISTESDYADVLTVGGEVSKKWTDVCQSRFTVSKSYYNRPNGTDFDYFTGCASTTYRVSKFATMLLRYDFTLSTHRNIGHGYNQNKVTLGALLAW